LRLLRDENDKPLFTLQQLACIVSSNNRQVASQNLENFRSCGYDFKCLVTRQRKVDEMVVSAVKEELDVGILILKIILSEMMRRSLCFSS
jgi:hypothetical protein